MTEGAAAMTDIDTQGGADSGEALILRNGVAASVVEVAEQNDGPCRRTRNAVLHAHRAVDW